MSVRKYNGKEKLTLTELAEIGWRLTEDQLRLMNLFEKVRQAEQEIYWRYKAAEDILSNITDNVTEKVKRKASLAEEQFFNPKRVLAKRVGSSPRAYGRTLPKPGTLLVKEHRFILSNAPRIKRENGQEIINPYKTFRFLVIDDHGSLIQLGDENGPIYNNPSIAARSATKNDSENGWSFFSIS